MRKIRNYILCLTMVIPMLVLLVHDIVPHKHHIHQIDDHQHVSVIQVHKQVHSHSHAHSHTNGVHWSHSHNTNTETCCILTHNRVQKENTFKVFLQEDKIEFTCEKTLKVQKFKLRNEELTVEPLRFSPHRRGPPNSFLA
jgi:hypothetical protein